MPPTTSDAATLMKRYFGSYNRCYNDGYNNGGYCNSRWDRWGRWVLLAVIIVAAIALFFCVSCITARRRRKNGYAPYRGTGWALGRTPAGHAPAQYNGGYNGQQTGTQPPMGGYYGNNTNAPPAYGSAPGGANQGYYGGQRNDVELQPPAQTYGGYAPPKGPPPGQS